MRVTFSDTIESKDLEVGLSGFFAIWHPSYFYAAQFVLAYRCSNGLICVLAH